LQLAVEGGEEERLQALLAPFGSVTATATACCSPCLRGAALPQSSRQWKRRTGGEPRPFWRCRSGAAIHVADAPFTARLNMGAHMFLALMKKELLALSRDIHGMGALFLMPMVFIIVMSMALKDVYTPASKSLTYAVVNQDQGKTAKKLLNDGHRNTVTHRNCRKTGRTKSVPAPEISADRRVRLRQSAGQTQQQKHGQGTPAQRTRFGQQCIRDQSHAPGRHGVATARRRLRLAATQRPGR